MNKIISIKTIIITTSIMMFVAVSFSHAQSGFRFIKENDSNKISEVRGVTTDDQIKSKNCDNGEWIVIVGGRPRCVNYGSCEDGFIPEGIDVTGKLKCKKIPDIPTCEDGEVVVGDLSGGHKCAFVEPSNLEECTDGKLIKYISENGKIIPKCVAPLDNQPTSFNNNSENLFSNLINFILLPLKAQTLQNGVTIGGLTEKVDGTLEIANGTYSGGGRKLTLKPDKFTLTTASDFSNVDTNSEYPPGAWCGLFGHTSLKIFRNCFKTPNDVSKTYWVNVYSRDYEGTENCTYKVYDESVSFPPTYTSDVGVIINRATVREDSVDDHICLERIKSDVVDLLVRNVRIGIVGIDIVKLITHTFTPHWRSRHGGHWTENSLATITITGKSICPNGFDRYVIGRDPNYYYTCIKE